MGPANVLLDMLELIVTAVLPTIILTRRVLVCAGAVGCYCTYIHYADCLASTTCNNHGSCLSDGSCQCAAGFTGAHCDQCAPNYYGYPNCVCTLYFMFSGIKLTEWR